MCVSVYVCMCVCVCVCVSCPFVHLCCFWLIWRNACYGMDIYNFPDRMRIKYFLPSCNLCICVWFTHGALHCTVLFCFLKFLCGPICPTFFWPLGLPPNLERPQDIEIEIQRSLMCAWSIWCVPSAWPYKSICVYAFIRGWQLRLYVLHVHSPILSFNLLIFYIKCTNL